jgi:hypothetical protein
MSFQLRTLLLAMTAAAALAAPAYAQAPTFSGFVSSEGVVSGSAGFSGARNSVGTYTVTAAQSMFTAGFPVMTVTPFGINGAYTAGVLDAALCENGTCTFSVTLLALKTAKPHDNAWAFTIVQAGP